MTSNLLQVTPLLEHLLTTLSPYWGSLKRDMRRATCQTSPNACLAKDIVDHAGFYVRAYRSSEALWTF